MFTVVIKELKWADRACIKFQEREGKQVQVSFSFGWKGLRGTRGRKDRAGRFPLTSTDTSADPSSVPSLFVCRGRSFLNNAHANTTCIALRTSSWTNTHTHMHVHTYRLHRGEPIREDGKCTVISNCHSSTSGGSCPASVSIIVHQREGESPHSPAYCMKQSQSGHSY